MEKVKAPSLGLRENLAQFILLVFVNAFVGGMVGLERTLIPELADFKFSIDTKTALLSFIMAFGFSKAISNYFTGRWSNRIGRKKILVLGWLFALPIPFMIIHSSSWNWIIWANIFLGINQGLCWSTTVIMKIDLVGAKNRGLAMGLNEFAGYLAVGLVAFIAAYLSIELNSVIIPFYLGVLIACIGLFLSVFLIKDTHSHVQVEQENTVHEEIGNVFINTSFKHRNLSAVTQAGMINNLNDGMIWGLLPILLINVEFDHQQIGLIAGVYPMVWGVSQLATGKWADHISGKKLIVFGMIIQGLAIICIGFTKSYIFLIGLAAILGIGTALVYPTFFVVIAQNISPNQRAESIGVFRLWRDSGYAFGALLSGIIADQFGVVMAVISIGVITILSGIVAQFRMKSA